MAKTKVYFWLKVDKKFFDNIFIKRLKTMAGGYMMQVIYMRLMLESLEDDCILYYEGYFKNLVEELALKLDVTEDDINMTMSYFTQCGLIQIDDDGNAMYFQKTKELLDKIKLYADVNYFETNFYDQLIIVQELLKSPTIDYKNHLELERLNKEISKKFILSQKFIGSQERTLSDEVYS